MCRFILNFSVNPLAHVGQAKVRLGDSPFFEEAEAEDDFFWELTSDPAGRKLFDCPFTDMKDAAPLVGINKLPDTES